MKKIAFVLLSFSVTFPVLAQKKALAYPFEFEKGFLQKGEYDAYFLDNQQAGNFAFILKDNKKVNYVLVNERFKVASQFTKTISGTVFDHETHRYLGGTTGGNAYHYIYKVTDKKFLSSSTTYLEETVDFDGKSVSNKKVFEIPKEEELLVSFSDHNRYFTITANKKTSDLQFYQVSADGETVSKTIHFPVPQRKNKDKNELTGYLAGLKVIREGEEPGLDLAIHPAKLFSYADRLVFMVNEGDNPTHEFIVGLPGYSVSEKFIDHSELEEKENRGKSYISSFLKNHRLFSLILNKKDIKIAVYNENDGSLINKMVLKEDDGLAALALPPVSDIRMGKTRKETDVDNLKKVIKAFTKGTEGLSVGTNKDGQYIVQVGTYDLVPMSTGGGGGYTGGFQANPAYSPMVNSQPMQVYNPFMYYTPGNSGYMTTSARYYKSMYFKVLMDSATLKTVHGRVVESIGEQIKDYMDDTNNPRAKAAKQFTIGGKQYYGYYDKDQVAYVIEEIMIRK
jgi:hypothetical protein